ncbi:MAG: DsbA family protein [Hyphomicrobiaceae bacterium]|nr:DsbA family protein [Hyphomicrobiaceae bacterium]
MAATSPEQRVSWVVGLAVLATAAGLLAGCASGQLTSAGGLTSDATPIVSPGSAYAVPTAATKADGTFNPFRDVHDVGSGPRQIIASPTLAEVLAPAGPLPEMALGRADAPVTVVKYASLTCPHCRKFHREIFPRFKRAYIDTGKVRFILREFPIGRSSGNATIALRCVPPEKYFTLYGRFLENQSKWVSQEVRLEAIHSIAAEVGLSRAAFDDCLKNQGMINGLALIKDRGRTLGIIGTPNFFVADKLVKSVLTYDELAAMVDAELTGSAAAAVAQKRQ